MAIIWLSKKKNKLRENKNCLEKNEYTGELSNAKDLKKHKGQIKWIIIESFPLLRKHPSQHPDKSRH